MSLVLTLKPGDKVQLGESFIVLKEIKKPSQVRLYFEADRSIPINRVPNPDVILRKKVDKNKDNKS